MSIGFLSTLDLLRRWVWSSSLQNASSSVPSNLQKSSVGLTNVCAVPQGIHHVSYRSRQVFLLMSLSTAGRSDGKWSSLVRCRWKVNDSNGDQFGVGLALIAIGSEIFHLDLSVVWGHLFSFVLSSLSRIVLFKRRVEFSKKEKCGADQLEVLVIINLLLRHIITSSGLNIQLFGVNQNAHFNYTDGKRQSQIESSRLLLSEVITGQDSDGQWSGGRHGHRCEYVDITITAKGYSSSSLVR